ncbi:MAG TPA: hypothetical protein VJ741_00820 [Solirubrobacteraceae bacterium]|nr:hypothetical protein [Solirubrobacteraceae bacterium]
MHPSLERDLTRLADGTIKGSRRDRLERRVANSPELQARLNDQRRAIAATRSLAELERAPVALHRQYRELVTRRRRRAPAIALGLAGSAGALACAIAGLGGGQAALTVAQAATIAVRPATTIVAEPASDDHVALPGVQAEGMPFPYWEDRFGWHATGERTDRIDGHALTTVFYRRGGERIAYTIVSGNALPPVAAAHTTVRGGTVLAGSWSGGRPVVTWLRRGHTCVLSGGPGVSFAALTQLAGWRSHGEIPF